MKPLADRVIIKQDEKIERKGAIILPEAAKQEKPRGTIVATGPQARDVRVGDKVLFNLNWRQDFTEEGQDYIVIREGDIIAVLLDGVEVEQPSGREV